jgi:hypothetical protein
MKSTSAVLKGNASCGCNAEPGMNEAAESAVLALLNLIPPIAMAACRLSPLG